MTETEHRIEKCIKDIDSVSKQMPGVVIIHDLRDNSVAYMSEKGLNILNVSLQELIHLGPDYFERFFNAEDAKNYTPLFLDFLNRNKDGEVFTFFQQVRSSPDSPWGWYLSASQIILRDDKENPLLSITIAQEIDALKSLTNKAERLLEENEFIQKNLMNFAHLTKREKEILGYVANGKTNSEISVQLFISLHTVQVHRKKIKKKLNFSSTSELFHFAQCFDLK